MYILSYISYLPLCQSYDFNKPMTVILIDRLWACTLQYFVTHSQSQSFKVEWKYFDKKSQRVSRNICSCYYNTVLLLTCIKQWGECERVLSASVFNSN